jgi:tRNA G18 (ribose-2'-O)-methylase SpoU
MGALGSLNVAAAGAVACFELARRRVIPDRGDKR